MLCLQNYSKDLPVNSSAPPVAVRRKRSGGRVTEQSSCSEGSLLSAGSSEPEDEFRSSRGDLASATAGSSSTAENSAALDTSDPDGEEPPGGLAPLSHSAARHKMAVRPRRTHGAPRRSRPNQMSPGTALPTTPEVNEDVARSITPEVISSGHHHSADSMMSSVQQSSIVTSNSRHIVTTSNVRYEKTETVTQLSGNMATHNSDLGLVPKETRLKSSSLPPGLALSQMVGQAGISPIKFSLSSNEELNPSVKISRSKSNAQKKDSSDTDESIMSFNENRQSMSERNLTHQSSNHGASMYKSVDMKFTNVLAGELQKRFGSVGEEEELLSSGNFETAKPEIKHRKGNEKSSDKIERHHDEKHHNEKHKNKHHEEETSEKHSSKKEESFFGRLLLRRSGKKNKKESVCEKEDHIVEENKKQQQTKEQSYRSYTNEHTTSSSAIKSSVTEHVVVRQQKMMCADQNAHKSVGQKVFANQNHKRIDPRGGYVNDPMIQESISNFSKGSTTEYLNDFKHFTDREKLSSEMQYSQSHLKVKDDVNIRRLSSENVSKIGGGHQASRSRQRMEPLDIPVSPEPQRKPPLLPRTTSQESKSFFPSINQGKVYPSKDVLNGSKFAKNVSPTSKLMTPTDDFQFPHSISPKIKMTTDSVFGFGSSAINHPGKHSDSNPKPMSYSVSPPRTVWPHNYDPITDLKSSSQGSLDPQSLRNSKSDYETRYFEYPNQLKGSEFDTEQSKSRPKIAGLSSYQQKITQIGSQMESDGDLSFPDSVTSRNPVIKSHSFRLNSDIIPMASQQDMPSLPPMFGISESSIDSWESTYKKHLKDASDTSSLELGSDSIMSYSFKANPAPGDLHFTDNGVFPVPALGDISKENLMIVNESLEESMKVNMYQKHVKQMTHYTKNMSARTSKTRDTDISRIEANIDSIIGSPKPLNCISLKSSSLDSVKSFSEKTTDSSRKALSNESISNNKIYVNQTTVSDVVGSVSFNSKLLTTESIIADSESFGRNLLLKPSNVPNSAAENHVSVTVLNSDDNLSASGLKTPESAKMSRTFDFTTPTSTNKSVPSVQVIQKDVKSFDKVSPNTTTTAVPEFMKIQLNKVDQKPVSNVVLSTNTSAAENKTKTPTKPDKTAEVLSTNNTQISSKRPDNVERSISYEPKKSEKFTNGHELKKSESTDKNIILETKEPVKPQRKFSSEDVEILEKVDTAPNYVQTNNVFNVPLKKTGSQTLLNRSTELLAGDNNSSVQTTFAYNKSNAENKPAVPTSLNLRKTNVVAAALPPPSPTAHKNFIKKKSGTFDYIETNVESLKRQSTPVMGSEIKPLDAMSAEKNNQNLKRMSSHELLIEQNLRTDRSSSSSDDCNLESAVILRKKSMGSIRTGKKDDEPELMKVFARRSLKLKDSETDALTQDILKMGNGENIENREETNDDSKKNSKYDFNLMTRSRDSDKENEADSPKDERKKSNASENIMTDSSQLKGGKGLIDYKKHSTETAELMQAQRMPKKLLDSNPVSINNAANLQPVRPASTFSFGGYQRSASANTPLSQTCNTKIENKIDTANYKKEISDSTPEKRFRNRTFPDSNDDGVKIVNNKTETTQYPVDTSSLPKRPWSTQMKIDENPKDLITKAPFRKSSFASPTEIRTPVRQTSLDKPIGVSQNGNDKSPNEPMTGSDSENAATDGEADGSPQFKGILEMRAQWERRAKQAMTK